MWPLLDVYSGNQQRAAITPMGSISEELLCELYHGYATRLYSLTESQNKLDRTYSYRILIHGVHCIKLVGFGYS